MRTDESDMSRSSTSSESGRRDAAGGAAAVAESAQQTGKAKRRGMSGTEQKPRGPKHAPGGKRSFFEIYKPGQGRYTRTGTAVGGGILIAGAGNFLFTQLEALGPQGGWALVVQIVVPLAVVVGLGLTLYWVVAVNRGTCDFFIATEGEMKKVSWSTRNEIVGSTKVVIGATLFLGLLLFVVDYAFMAFFRFIGVLWSSS
jgi:preprotein translocase SecE subunit